MRRKSPATRISRFLSLVLRHDPGKIGLRLDSGGWATVDALLAGMARSGFALDRAALDHLVATDNKQRYVFDETGTRIRASQGHSLDVDLGLTPTVPPDRLFHGTVDRVLDSIAAEGLRPMNRHHVHLSPDRETATVVGGRRGQPVVLVVESGAMYGDGHLFFVSANRVWLTDAVPPAYLSNLADLVGTR